MNYNNYIITKNFFFTLLVVINICLFIMLFALIKDLKSAQQIEKNDNEYLVKDYNLDKNPILYYICTDDDGNSVYLSSKGALSYQSKWWVYKCPYYILNKENNYGKTK